MKLPYSNSLVDRVSIAQCEVAMLEKEFSSPGFTKLLSATNFLFEYCIQSSIQAESKGKYWFGPRKGDAYYY